MEATRPFADNSCHPATTQTLFRLNNFASKLISTYCKRYGLAYINVILNSVVETICLSATNEQTYWSVEVGPNPQQRKRHH